MNKQEELELKAVTMDICQRLLKIEAVLFPKVLKKEDVKTIYGNRVPTYTEDSE